MFCRRAEKLLTSSRNGVNRGVAGMPPPLGTSCDGTVVLFLAGVFGTAAALCFVFMSSSGLGSLKGTIFDATAELDADAIRRVRPACFKVLPAALPTSGIFSFTRDLRVPTSGYEVNESAVSTDSAPEGSTKIWRRAFESGRDPGRGPRVST